MGIGRINEFHTVVNRIPPNGKEDVMIRDARNHEDNISRGFAAFVNAALDDMEKKFSHARRL